MQFIEKLKTFVVVLKVNSKWGKPLANTRLTMSSAAPITVTWSNLMFDASGYPSCSTESERLFCEHTKNLKLNVKKVTAKCFLLQWNDQFGQKKAIQSKPSQNLLTQKNFTGQVNWSVTTCQSFQYVLL